MLRTYKFSNRHWQWAKRTVEGKNKPGSNYCGNGKGNDTHKQKMMRKDKKNHGLWDWKWISWIFPENLQSHVVCRRKLK